MITPEKMQADTEQAPVKLAASRQGRVYVAGPMTGIKDFNFPAFNQAAQELRTLGLTVLNPADHGVVEGATWADYLRHDIALLSTCERIHLLPGWPKSKGARLELHIAKTLGMEITTAPGAELVAEVELGDPWGSLMLGGSLTFHNVEFQANRLTDEQTSQTASVAGLAHRDVPEADFGNTTERRGEPPELVPREWRQALRKLAFMARTSGGTSGPDAGLQAALQEAEEMLAKPYSHTSPQVPEGFALVPVEPTPKMIQRVRWLEYTESSLRMSPVDDDTVRSVWSDVIDAARKGE